MEEYTIKGGDGNEYGPVSEKVIRQWVNQGRANAQTQARKTGGDFMPLSSFAELANLFSAPAAAPSSGPVTLAQPSSALAPASSGPVGFEAAAAPAYGYGAGNSTDSTVITLMEPIAKASFWLKFMGVLQILFGIMTAISIIGIIVAWLPIWLGVLMWQSANRAKEAAMSGDALTALQAQNKIKMLFIIMGIFTLLYLLFMIAYVIFIIYAATTNPELFDQLQQYQQHY